MNKRLLGKSGIEISEVSFGTVSLGVPYGIGIKNSSNMIKMGDAVLLLRDALAKGVNFFDTARGYGNSETILGKAFKGCRDKVVICTKPSHVYDSHAGQCLLGSSEIKKTLDESLSVSLNELQTDYIDILMSHDSAIEFMNHPAVIDFFQSAKKKGVVRATGISTYTVEESLGAINSGLWDVIQLPFNLMEQSQAQVFELARKKGVGLVIRSVLFKGILTDRGKNIHPELEKVKKHRALYKELLNNEINTLSDLATKFVLSFDEISSVLLGIDKPEYLESALKVADGNYFDRETLEKARAMDFPDPAFLDLPKWNRLGWL